MTALVIDRLRRVVLRKKETAFRSVPAGSVSRRRRRSCAGARKCVLSSARERNEQAQAAEHDDVVHDLVHAELHTLLRVDDVFRVETQREPLVEVEFHAEAGGTRESDVAGFDGGPASERYLEVVATDGAAEPAHLAVGERPHQMPEKELNRVLLAFDDVDETLLAFVDGFEQRVALAGAEVSGFEAEIFREVEGVRAAIGERTVGDVARVPSPERGELVAQRFLDQARNDAAVGALADELLFQRLVDTLRLRAGRKQCRRETEQRCYDERPRACAQAFPRRAGGTADLPGAREQALNSPQVTITGRVLPEHFPSCAALRGFFQRSCLQRCPSRPRPPSRRLRARGDPARRSGRRRVRSRARSASAPSERSSWPRHRRGTEPSPRAPNSVC